MVRELTTALHMNGSDHNRYSYANNSILQRKVIRKTRPILKQAIKTMHLNKSFSEQCFTMADLGCASGPNTLFSLSYIIHSIVGLCRQAGQSPPEFQVFLNDLPTNDFNSLFRSLHSNFYKSQRLMKQKGCAPAACYISGTPGSFYGRIFPSSTLHFVHSSYSLQWLSQVPRGIESNKGHIFTAKTSPPDVFEAYLDQFETDFTNFISNRDHEMKPGGAMVLTFIGRSNDDPTTNDCCLFWELLSKSLLDMSCEGLIEEVDVDSFNIPNYYPSKGEVKRIVQREGSFHMDHISSFQVNWGVNDIEEPENNAFDARRSGQNMANCIRAVAEPMIASHFGEDVIPDLFARYAKYVAEHLSVEKTKFFNIVLRMSEK